ncbi:uncharacterized protein UTRI_01922 [Ustilago trichophora]|uniref:Uncharacterized protein n=1 Tax=Ustilago trichophora TaxID=86804 RepID=A0A5C3DXQ9_9BASI|nr:uncharacterized protein UTRI_01922 [Ustilago trichophora]
MLTPSNPFSVPASSSAEIWQRLEARRPAPLRFVLHLSRRTNASLCPCLEVDLPSSSSPHTFYTVTRILDPEHRTPYITLSSIFFAANLTLISGLLRFNLSPVSFDLSLAGLEPWDDLWIGLPLARHIASQLGLASALAAILDGRSSAAWSLDEFEDGLSHNWRVPQQFVDAASYSTDAITDPQLRFAGVQMLPTGQQIKTLISGEMRSVIARRANERRRENKGRLHESLMRWSSQLYSLWIDARLGLQGEKQWEEKDNEKEGRLRALLDDLKDVVVPPTNGDFSEWTQLLPTSSADSDPLRPKLDPELHEETTCELLSPLSLAELAELRSTDPTLGHILTSDEGEDAEETIARLHSFLRARMATLHRMNVLSFPHLCLADEGEGHGGGVDLPQESSGGARIHAAPSQTQREEKGRDEELAELHTKLDRLTTKLDSLLESQTLKLARRSSAESATPKGMLAGDKDKPRADIFTRSVLAHAQPPLSALTNIEATPSLIIIIVSVVLFFMIVKFSDD